MGCGVITRFSRLSRIDSWVVGDRIYVASVNDNEADPNRGSTVSVIDGATNTTIGAAIIVGNTPRGIGVDPGVNRIYVAAASDEP